MLNRDIYQKDPSTRKLVNEGVASVNDEKTNQALSVLRYELDTFVCDGQYEKGLEHILDTYGFRYCPQSLHRAMVEHFPQSIITESQIRDKFRRRGWSQ